VIITIGGEYGSGSKETARIVARDLGYAVYDGEIVKEAYRSGSSYIDEPTLRYYDESEGTANVNEIAAMCNAIGERSEELTSLSLDVLPQDLRLDAAINGTLNRIADGDNCIILGKCANYYLRGRKNVISLFFADTDEHRSSRIMKYLGCDRETAHRIIAKIDKRRSDSYSYFTGEEWDDAENYDMRINCDLLGEDGSAELIRSLIDIKEKQL